MKIEELFPGVRVEIGPAPGECSTCCGKGKVVNRFRSTMEAACDRYGVLRSLRLVADRACPHCWGSGREPRS